jgi:hypothetical protein
MIHTQTKHTFQSRFNNSTDINLFGAGSFQPNEGAAENFLALTFISLYDVSRTQALIVTKIFVQNIVSGPVCPQEAIPFIG